MRYALIALIALCGGAGIASAHATGFTYEQTAGSFLVDIGYDIQTPVVGVPVTFDFNISPAAIPTQSGPHVTDVWVRIERESMTVFASGIHVPAFGRPTLLYAFPEPGKYKISVRFEDDAQTFAEAAMPITVTPTETSLVTLRDAIALGAGILLGGPAALLLVRRRRLDRGTGSGGGTDPR